MGPQDVPLDQYLALEIDGPEVSPETADVPAVLELASAFFQLVKANANEIGEIKLTNLQIVDKCLAIIALPDNLELARNCAEEAVRQIAGSDPPRGGGEYVTRARNAIKHMPSDHHARVLAGPWHRDVTIEQSPIPEPLDSVLAIRAVPIRVGGSRPAVRFRSEIEDEFTLATTQTVAREIGQHLYREVDIDAIVRRDADGTIIGGKLISFDSVMDEDPRAAWSEWFQSVGVDDVTAEKPVELS